MVSDPSYTCTTSDHSPGKPPAPGNAVQVIEAGSWHKYNLMKAMPAGVYAVFKDPALNWNYESVSPPPPL